MSLKKIESLFPILDKGWVAMDKDGKWYWFEKKPVHNNREWDRCFCDIQSLSDNFNIEFFDGDWKDSLRRIK